jgi:uncharacterized protein DUF4253
MAEVPADGEVRIGTVRLPAGRRIHAGTPAAGYGKGSGISWRAEQEAAASEWARAYPGVPLLWATDEPVPDVGQVWHELQAMAGETGLVPVRLAFLDRKPGHRGRPWDSGELGDPYPLSAADEVDAAAVLHGLWDFDYDPDDDPREIEVLRSLPEKFPGLAPASTDPLSDAELRAALRMMRPARLGLVPAARPADVLMLVGFGGLANRYEQPAEFTAVLRSWEERFGALLVEVGFADVRLLVTRPPRSPRAAELAAAEIYCMCDEFWPIERPGTAFRSVSEIADYIRDAPFWGLWWD